MERQGLVVGRRTVLRTGGALALGMAVGGAVWGRPDAVAAPADNLVPNGDFEQLTNGFPTGWRQFNTANPVTRVSSPAHGGVSAVRLAGASSGLRSASVEVTGGETYEASVWMLVTAGSPDLYLEFWNAAGSRVQVSTTKAVTASNWQPLSVRAVAPTSAVRASVLVYSSSVNAGEAVADDAGLRLVTAAELLQVPNADFELVAGSQPALWTQWNAQVPYDSSDTVAHHGAHSAHYANPSWTTKGGLRSSKVTVRPGTRYEVTARTRSAQGNPVISLEYWDASNVRLSAYYSDPGPRSADWYPISTMATAPAGAVAATVMLYSGAAPTEIWWDEVAIGEVAPEQVRTHTARLTGHPRYNLGPDDVTRLRGLAAATTPNAIGLVGQELFDQIVGQAEAFLTETAITLTYYNGHRVTYPAPPPQPAPMPPPPGFSGKYPYWSALGVAVKARLDTLAGAYTLTGRADFADKIKSYVTTLAGWDAWADPQFGVRADQFTGYVSQAVATAYDQIHDSFSDAERAQVTETLVSKGLELIYDDALPGGGQIGATAPALTMGGLILLGEDDRADRFLTRAEDMYRIWMDYRLESGQNEGISYTAFTTNPMVRSLAALERVTGNTELSRHRFLTEHLWRWLLYAAAPPASFAAYSDGLAKGYMGSSLHYLNRFLDNGWAGWLLSTCDFGTSWDVMDKIYWFEADAPVSDPSTLPSSAFLPEVGEADLRSGFTPEHTLLTIRANDSVYGHNHYDQASVQLAIGGAWIGRDPGYQDLGTSGPTAVFSQREGHSTVLVDGRGQTQLGQGTLGNAFLTEGFDHVLASAAGAYVNPDLTRFTRRAMRIGANRYVLVDDVAAPQGHRFTFQLFHGPLYQHHVDGTAVAVGSAVPGIGFHAHNGAAELWGHSADGQPQTVGFVEYEGAEPYGLQLHVSQADTVTSSTRFTTLEAVAVHDDRHLLAADLHARMVAPTASVSQNAGVTFLAQGAGNLDIRITVPATGEYSLDSVFMTGYSYGYVSLAVDGTPLGGPYDPSFFGLVPGSVFRHGVVHLAAGDHVVRYSSVPGPRGGTTFAVQSLRVVPVAEADVARDLGLTAEHRTGQGISGLMTSVDTDLRTAVLGAEGDVGWLTEWAVTTDGTARRLGELVTDAEALVLQAGRGRGEAALHRLGAIRATTVELGGMVLASSTTPANLSVDASSAGAVSIAVDAAGPTTVEVRIGRRWRDRDGRIAVQAGKDAYGVSLDLAAGEHRLVLVR